MNLPFFGAEASGLFADMGLDVDLVDPVDGGPDLVRRIADGEADFCVTGVYYFLAARQQQSGGLKARFVGMVHQRSPMAAIVSAGSAIVTPADLAGRRVAVGKLGWLVDEYEVALAGHGLGPSVRVTVDENEPHRGLATGEVDVVAAWEDALPVVRQRAGTDVRAIPVGPDVYVNGLVAADHVDAEVVSRMRRALSIALHQQRRNPQVGLAEMCSRFPQIDPDAAQESWSILERYAFTWEEPGSLDGGRWQRTLDHAAAAHGFKSPALVSMP